MPGMREIRAKLSECSLAYTHIACLLSNGFSTPVSQSLLYIRDTLNASTSTPLYLHSKPLTIWKRSWLLSVSQIHTLEGNVINLPLSLSLFLSLPPCSLLFSLSLSHTHQPTVHRGEQGIQVSQQKQDIAGFPPLTRAIERFPVRSPPKKPARESARKNNFLCLKFNWRLFMTQILLTTYIPKCISEHWWKKEDTIWILS